MSKSHPTLVTALISESDSIFRHGCLINFDFLRIIELLLKTHS